MHQFAHDLSCFGHRLFRFITRYRSVQDALEAPRLDSDEEVVSDQSEPSVDAEEPPLAIDKIERNDIAIRGSGEPNEEIQRFFAALSEMTGRRGIRDEISRYEAIGLALIEPRGSQAGESFQGFPAQDSPLHADRFFPGLYQQYDERFVFGAPLLASRTRRRVWSSASPIFGARQGTTAQWPELDYPPRIL